MNFQEHQTFQTSITYGRSTDENVVEKKEKILNSIPSEDSINSRFIYLEFLGFGEKSIDNYLIKLKVN
jgi:hypothetical protein